MDTVETLLRENKNLRFQRGMLIFSFVMLVFIIGSQHYFISEYKGLIQEYEILSKGAKDYLFRIKEDIVRFSILKDEKDIEKIKKILEDSLNRDKELVHKYEKN